MSRSLVRAGVLAFVLAAAASLTLIGERLTRGAPMGAFTASVLLLVVSFVVWLEARTLTGTRPCGALVATQVVGGAAAVALAHALVALVHPAGLVEQPRQFVNDIVFVGSIFAFAWTGGARSLLGRMALVAPAAAVLVGYAATSSRWHCDLPTFVQPIQQLVVVQAMFVAMGLLVVDLMPRRS